MCVNDKVGLSDRERFCEWQVRAAEDCLLTNTYVQQKNIRLVRTKVRRAARSNIFHFY